MSIGDVPQVPPKGAPLGGSRYHSRDPKGMTAPFLVVILERSEKYGKSQ